MLSDHFMYLQYDLRVYALVTCLNPLRVYLYEEGLVRFASEPFTLHRSKLRYLTHLTFFSLGAIFFLFSETFCCMRLEQSWLLRPKPPCTSPFPCLATRIALTLPVSLTPCSLHSPFAPLPSLVPDFLLPFPFPCLPFCLEPEGRLKGGLHEAQASPNSCTMVSFGITALHNISQQHESPKPSGLEHCSRLAAMDRRDLSCL